MYLPNVKLRNQLIMLIFISVMTIIFIQVFYYIRFNQIIYGKVEYYATNITNQANGKLDMISDNLKKAANEAAFNSTTQQYFMEKDLIIKKNLQDAVYNIMATIISSNPGIMDIAFYKSNSDIFSANSTIDSEMFKHINSKYPLKNIKSPSFIFFMQKSYISLDNKLFGYLIPDLNVYGANDGSGEKISCFVLLKIQYIQEIVNNAAATPNSIFFLTDIKNEMIVSNTKKIDSDMFSAINSYKKATVDGDTWTNCSYNGKYYMVKQKTNSNTGWKMTSMIPVDELSRELDVVRISGILLGIAVTFILLAAGLIIFRNITTPINTLIHKMRTIGEKNIKQRINIRQHNEIGVIAEDIDLMLDKIELMTSNIFNMQARLYESELSKRQAEYSALQSQINPHFLYNTLECIRSISAYYHILEIQNISIAMSKIFRYSIKGDNYTSVLQEIECIKDYLVIMKIRFQDKFSTRINVDPSIMELQIVKMILQPIVENAFYHGLEQKDEKGCFELLGHVQEDSVIFEINDDGVGMREEEVEELNGILHNDNLKNGMILNEKRSIGLVNINSRLKLYYGSRYGISVKSTLNKGTSVVITLPVKNMEI